MIPQSVLQDYIEQIFLLYDKDRSNSLQPHELANFLNDIFKKMGKSLHFTQNQAVEMMRQIDANFDGRASRLQLLIALRRIVNRENVYISNSSNKNYVNYNVSSNNFLPTNSTINQQQPQSNYIQTSIVKSGYQPHFQSSYRVLNNPQNYQSQNYQNYQNYNQQKVTRVLSPSKISVPTNETSIMRPVINSYVSSTNVYSQPQINTQTNLNTNSYVSHVNNNSVLSSTVHQPGYKKVTTMKGPNGYQKIRTETFTSETRYIY